MYKKQRAEKALLAQKVLPLYYHDSVEVSMSVLKALYDGGIKVVEYTNRGDAALENFSKLCKKASKQMPDLILGIGTIKTKREAKKFIAAGAHFIVCPTMHDEVGKVAAGENMLWIPGCMTPTEIAEAEAAGARLVKLFPGNLLGPSFIMAIKDIFPNMGFIVTGGVEAEAQNLQSWFDAGAAGLGMGSKLITKKMLEERDFEGLKLATQKLLETVKQFR